MKTIKDLPEHNRPREKLRGVMVFGLAEAEILGK